MYPEPYVVYEISKTTKRNAMEKVFDFCSFIFTGIEPIADSEQIKSFSNLYFLAEKEYQKYLIRVDRGRKGEKKHYIEVKRLNIDLDNKKFLIGEEVYKKGKKVNFN